MKYKIVELAPLGGESSYIIKKKGWFGRYSSIMYEGTFKEFYFGTLRPKIFNSIEKATTYIKDIHLKDIEITHTKEIGL
jgi:hypothetical protein